MNLLPIDQFFRMPHRMNQHHVAKALPGGSVAQHGDEGGDPRPGGEQPKRLGVGELRKHEEAGRVGRHVEPLARLQAGKARRERALGDHDAVELEHRVVGRVDHGERPRHPLAVDVERDAHELAGLERKRRAFDAQREQRLGPMPIFDDFAFEPLCH